MGTRRRFALPLVDFGPGLSRFLIPDVAHPPFFCLSSLILSACPNSFALASFHFLPALGRSAAVVHAWIFLSLLSFTCGGAGTGSLE